MPGKTRIPQTKSEFDQYIQNTGNYLNTAGNGTRLGLTAAEVTAWNTKKTAWTTLYPTYSNKATRTTTNTEQVKVAQKDFGTFAMPLLDRMAASTAITTTDRNTLNLPTIDKVPTKRGMITEVPYVEFFSLPGGRIEIRTRVNKDASRSSMPPLADGVEIKYLIGTAAPVNVTAAGSSTISKKAKFLFDTDGTKATQRFYGYARYVNLSNPANNGSFSPMNSVVIQG